MSERQTVAGAYAKIESHEDLCAERYRNIHETLTELKTGVADQHKLLWATLVGTCGFALITLVAIVLKSLHLT